MRSARALELIEAGLGLGAISIAGWLSGPDHWGLLDLWPHPYWLVILLIGVRYGVPAGYLASVAAAGLLLAFQATAPRSDGATGDLASFLPSLPSLLPAALFILVGGLIAELAESHKRRYRRLDVRYQEVAEAFRDLAQRYLAATEVKAELEQRIVGQTATVSTLYEAAKRLETLLADDLYPAILDLVVRFLQAGGCAVYVADSEVPRLRAGWPAHPSWPRDDQLDPRHPLIELLWRERRPVTIRDLPAREAMGTWDTQRLIMAAPLIGRDDRIAGVVTVERLPFLKFTPSHVKLFSIIADWASSALQSAQLFAETKDRNVEDEATGAYSAIYTRKRLAEELRRAHRYGLALSVLLLRIDDYGDIQPPMLSKVLQVLGFVFHRNLRDVDLVGRYTDPATFLLVLPVTPLDGARVVARRVHHEITTFGFRPFSDPRILTVSVGVASYRGGTASADQVLAEAEADLAQVADLGTLTTQLAETLEEIN